MKCTVELFGSNVYIYKTSSATFSKDSHELVCSSSMCRAAGSNQYTGTVDGLVITITIPKLTIQENEKYWTCSQDNSEKNLLLFVYSKYQRLSPMHFGSSG